MRSERLERTTANVKVKSSRSLIKLLKSIHFVYNSQPFFAFTAHKARVAAPKVTAEMAIKADAPERETTPRSPASVAATTSILVVQVIGLMPTQ